MWQNIYCNVIEPHCTVRQDMACIHSSQHPFLSSGSGLACAICHREELVSEPDSQKMRKEGQVNGAGWKCTLQNGRNFTLHSLWVFSWARHTYKHSIFPISDGSHAVSTFNTNTSECFIKANWKYACIPGAVYTSSPSHIPDLLFNFFLAILIVFVMSIYNSGS